MICPLLGLSGQRGISMTAVASGRTCHEHLRPTNRIVYASVLADRRGGAA
jgi:hypothetical protein